MKGELINNYYEALRQEKKPRAERMKELAELIAPHRALNTEITDKPSEEHLGEDIYDGSPIDAARKMTDGIFGNSVGPTSTWMEQDSPERYNNDRLDKWIRYADKTMFDLFLRSDFYRSIYQAIRDGVTLGNTAILTRPGGRGISYKAINPFHYFFEEDEMQNLILWIYRFPMTSLKAKKMFGDNAPKEVDDDLEGENYTETRWYLYTVMENETAYRIGGVKPKTQMPYQSYIKLLESDEIISSGGFRENPVALWQYFRESGEKWGRGPGDEAFFDIQYVNRLSQSILESVELRAAPPMQAPMEFKTNQRLSYKPKAVNYYQSPERKAEFMAPGGEYSRPIDLLNRKDEIIGYHFMVDFWTMLSRSTKRMTAYEVSEEQSEKLSLLSYAIQNFFSNFVTPILERSYSIAMESRIIKPPDPDVAQGVTTNFKFNGLLAQAQRKAVEGTGMMRAFNEVMPLAEFAPESLMVIDWEQFARRRFEINNVDATIIRNKRELKEMKEQMAQQQQQQQQSEQVTEAAKAADKPKFEDVLGAM